MGWAGVGVAAVVIVGVGGYLAYEATKSPSSTTTSSTSTTTTPTVVTTTTPTVTSSSQALPTIKLGAVLSLTGAFAGFGQGMQYGHQAAIKDLNALGGMQYGNNRINISYKAYDDGSNPTNGASLASQAILSDGVDVLMHGNGPPVTTIPIGTTAERYNTPFIMGSPFEPWSAAGPWKYSWSILFRIGTQPTGFPSQGYTITSAYFGLNDSVFSQTNGNASVLACGDSDGTGWYGVFPPAMSGHSPAYTVIDALLYPTGTSDFSSAITDWKNKDVEILWANLPAPDFGTFWRQASELGFRPKIALIGRAPLFFTDINAWGDNLPLDVCTECWWDPTWPFKGVVGSSTTPTSLAAGYTAGGTPLNRNIAFGYSAVQILNDAVGRAGSVDKDTVNTAIGETNITAMTGPIKFFPDTHDSPCPVTIKQWQAGTGSQPAWIDPIVFSQLASSGMPAPGTFAFPLPPWS
ncbi:MAG TPA: ABC transporter substrate-binding protein [Nitrososphaerales archaeon]|nr:ABC transporter substrate-binding protein [Nitrososphaerales archaeon]